MYIKTCHFLHCYITSLGLTKLQVFRVNTRPDPKPEAQGRGRAGQAFYSSSFFGSGTRKGSKIRGGAGFKNSGFLATLVLTYLRMVYLLLIISIVVFQMPSSLNMFFIILKDDGHFDSHIILNCWDIPMGVKYLYVSTSNGYSHFIGFKYTEILNSRAA